MGRRAFFFGLASSAAVGAALLACELVSGLAGLTETPEMPSGGETGSTATARPDDDGGRLGADGRAPDAALDPATEYQLHLSVFRCSITTADGSVNCSRLADGGVGPTCDVVFAAGTELTLDTTGFGVFNGWGGSCLTEQTEECHIVMDSDQDASCSYSTGSP